MRSMLAWLSECWWDSAQQKCIKCSLVAGSSGQSSSSLGYGGRAMVNLATPINIWKTIRTTAWNRSGPDGWVSPHIWVLWFTDLQTIVSECKRALFNLLDVFLEHLINLGLRPFSLITTTLLLASKLPVATFCSKTAIFSSKISFRLLILAVNSFFAASTCCAHLASSARCSCPCCSSMTFVTSRGPYVHLTVLSSLQLSSLYKILTAMYDFKLGL